MIIRNEDRHVDYNENVFGGSGKIRFDRIIETPEELCNKGRVFSIATLEPGCELGYHVHKGDCEFYYVLSGEGEYSDNGVMTTLRRGDSGFCPDGEGHSIKNTGSEPLVFVALILYT